MKLRLYTSGTSDQHTTTADLPIDGKPHKILQLFNGGGNNPRFPGKVMANTVSISDFKDATFTVSEESGKKLLVRPPNPAGLDQKIAEGDLDVSNYSVTATAGGAA